MRSGLILLLVFAGLMTGLSMVPTTPPRPRSVGLTENEAIAALRTINTAEMDLHFTGHAYASLGELLRHRFLLREGVAQTITEKTDTTGVVKDYQITVAALADHKGYSVSLLPVPASCRGAFFTNEAGIIYKGQPLDCPPWKK